MDTYIFYTPGKTKTISKLVFTSLVSFFNCSYLLRRMENLLVTKTARVIKLLMFTGATHMPEDMNVYRCFARLRPELLFSLLRLQLAGVKALCAQRLQNETSEGAKNKHGLPGFM